MLCVAFASLTKLREPAALLAPTQRILGPWMKNTDTHSCSISTCLFGIIARRYLSPAWRSMPLSILLAPHLSTCPQLYSVTFNHCATAPNCPPVEVATPPLSEAWWPLPLLSLHLFPCLRGREAPPTPSAQQLAHGFFNDRSGTNWGSGH